MSISTEKIKVSIIFFLFQNIEKNLCSNVKKNDYRGNETRRTHVLK